MFYMAVDQYGTTHHGLKHPRKELMQEYGTKHADKMYVNASDGRTLHIGYIIRDHWFTLYEVKRMEQEA